jgi:hypothetical protein
MGVHATASEISFSVKLIPYPRVDSILDLLRILNSSTEMHKGESKSRGEFLENIGFPFEKEKQVEKFLTARNIHER